MSLTNIGIGIVVSLAIVGAASTVAYNKGYTNGENFVKTQQDKETDKHNKEITRKNTVIASLSRNLETLKLTQKQLERNTDENAKKELTDAVYSRCVVPPSGVRDLSTTAERLNTLRNSGKPDDKVPGTRGTVN